MWCQCRTRPQLDPTKEIADLSISMSSLTILGWSGDQREVRFVGWTDQTRAAFFMRDEQGIRRTVNLRLPGISYLKFRDNPIPNLPVVRISRTALHVPPCFSSNEQAEASRDRRSVEYFNTIHQLGTQWKLYSAQTVYLE